MNISLARQVLSFGGALLILIAYAALQMEWMKKESVAFNMLNAVGSAVLAYIAFHPFQIGFVILEGAWALISVYSLLRPAKRV
jgi:hypothetical protein